MRFSAYSYSKQTFGKKLILFLEAGDPDSNSNVLAASNVSGLAGVVGSASQMGAFRDFRHHLYMKNVSTYQLRVRVITWACRSTVPFVAPAAISGGGSSPYSSLANMMSVGISGGRTADGSGAFSGIGALESTDVDFSPFQNPLWVQHWKGLKVRQASLRIVPRSCSCAYSGEKLHVDAVPYPKGEHIGLPEEAWLAVDLWELLVYGL